MGRGGVVWEIKGLLVPNEGVSGFSGGPFGGSHCEFLVQSDKARAEGLACEAWARRLCSSVGSNKLGDFQCLC